MRPRVTSTRARIEAATPLPLGDWDAVCMTGFASFTAIDIAVAILGATDTSTSPGPRGRSGTVLEWRFEPLPPDPPGRYELTARQDDTVASTAVVVVRAVKPIARVRVATKRRVSVIAAGTARTQRVPIDLYRAWGTAAWGQRAGGAVTVDMSLRDSRGCHGPVGLQPRRPTCPRWSYAPCYLIRPRFPGSVYDEEFCFGIESVDR